MTSTSIYQPYFYIIQHKVTKKMYAGSRWAKGCHPNEFMQPNGYKTSSTKILEIIEQEGIDIFDVIKITTQFNTPTVYEYESKFLQENKCAESDDWYNKHNNTGVISFGTTQFKNQMIEKYGVDHISKLPKYKDIKRSTFMKNFGVEYPFQSEFIRNKSDATKLQRYGLLNYNNMEKNKTTKLERYGNENFNNINQIKETKLERYGNENFNNQEKIKSTNLNKYGTDSTNRVDSIKYKKKISFSKKYGVNWFTLSEEFKIKSKNSCLEKYGVEHTLSFKFFSIIETKKSYSKAHLTRYYPEFKSYY